MDSAQAKGPNNLLTLKQASEMLDVPIETLLEWNENNIFKPTITHEGQAGYTQEQINKFLAVQQLFQKDDADRRKETMDNNNSPVSINQRNTTTTPQKSGPQNNGYTEVVTRAANDKKIGGTKNTVNDTDTKTSKFKLLTIGSTSAMVVILFSLVLTGHEGFSPQEVSNLKASNNQTSTSKLENIKFAKSDASEKQVPLVKNPGDYEDNNITGPNDTSGSSISFLGNNAEADPDSETVNQSPPETGSADDLKVNDPGSLASRNNVPSDSSGNHSVFDTQGNINEDAAAQDGIAASLGTTIFNRDQGFNRTMNIGIIFTSLTLGLLWFLYILHKQPVFSGIVGTIPDTKTGSGNAIKKQTVLEVDQKTDGAVVVLFQDKEYKITKPELNSETDRFIQRILSLTKDIDGTEIEYDILKDEKLRLNAPLSKIVTRLGFVGTKRDLFFPRTSKNKVVFRRYLTRQDVESIGLSITQISDELAD